MAKVLLLGGTGAIGVYLIPELISLGFEVTVTSRSARTSDHKSLTYLQGDAHEDTFIQKTVADKYDAIVDFMVYSTSEFRRKHEWFLQNTEHYIFTSSSRVFAESHLPITEKTDRLLDVSEDSDYLTTDEYALAKARQEDILRESPYQNWTIVRPTITYSKTRFQLGTLEANTILFRSQYHCPVILPQEMLQKQATMTWGGDVAKMMSRLVLIRDAFCEDFNAVTHEHHTWEEMAQYYQELIGLTVVPTSLEDYIKTVGGKYQILHSRMYHRVMDNSKILKITGIQKENLTSVYDGLKRELSDYAQSRELMKPNYVMNARMDRMTHSRISLEKASVKEKLLYYSAYFGVYEFLKKGKNMIMK